MSHVNVTCQCTYKHDNLHTQLSVHTHIAQRRCTHTVMKEIYTRRGDLHDDMSHTDADIDIVTQTHRHTDTRRQDLGEAGEGRKDHGVSVCQHRARGRLSARDRLAPHGDLQTCIRELGH